MSEKSGPTDWEISALALQLSDYSTRSAARRRLLIIGESAVPALADALGSPVEGVAWSAAKTLGEIGCESAVEPLIETLANPSARDAALEALRRITGHDYGEDSDAWRRARGRASTASATAMSDEDLAKALCSASVSCGKQKSGYAFSVQLAGGRRQKVDMLLSLKDSDGSPLVAFYTECGPADPSRFEWALKMNLRVPFGAFALRASQGEDKFVMVDAYLRESATVQQLVRALEVLARRADEMEKTLTGLDDH